MSTKGPVASIGIGLLMGAVVGATIGILYAPHPGKVTRDIIDERLRDATHRAKKIIEEAEDKAQNILKEARAKIGR